jgi:hypothetical protein
MPRPTPVGPRGTSPSHSVAGTTAVRDGSSETRNVGARRTQRFGSGPGRGGQVARLRPWDRCDAERTHQVADQRPAGHARSRSCLTGRSGCGRIGRASRVAAHVPGSAPRDCSSQFEVVRDGSRSSLSRIGGGTALFTSDSYPPRPSPCRSARRCTDLPRRARAGGAHGGTAEGSASRPGVRAGRARGRGCGAAVRARAVLRAQGGRARAGGRGGVRARRARRRRGRDGQRRRRTGRRARWDRRHRGGPRARGVPPRVAGEHRRRAERVARRPGARRQRGRCGALLGGPGGGARRQRGSRAPRRRRAAGGCRGDRARPGLRCGERIFQRQPRRAAPLATATSWRTCAPLGCRCPPTWRCAPALAACGAVRPGAGARPRRVSAPRGLR